MEEWKWFHGFTVLPCFGSASVLPVLASSFPVVAVSARTSDADGLHAR